jgi:hypothetical protein
MERSIEVLALIFFGVFGLSHLLKPKAWVEFFTLLRNHGEAGAFVDGFLNLPLRQPQRPRSWLILGVPPKLS